MLVVCLDCGHCAQVSDQYRGKTNFKCKRCGGKGKISTLPEPIKNITPNVIPEGKCKKCGLEIPEIRLQSKPGVKFCIDCEPRGTREVNPWIPRGVRIPTGYD